MPIDNLTQARERIAELEDETKALKQKNEFNSLMLDTTDLLAVALNTKGQIVFFNHACEEATGFSFEELKDEYIWDYLILPEQMEGVKGIFNQLAFEMMPNSYENYWRTKDGDQILVAWSNTLQTNDEGEIEHIISTGLDVTELRKAEQKLRQSEENFRAFVEGTDDLVTHVDNNGNFIWFNPTGEKMWNVKLEDYIGKPFLTFVHPDDKESTEKAFGEWLANREDSVTYENRNVNPETGEVYHLAWTINLYYDEDGNFASARSIARNITSLKETEQQLLENQQRLAAAEQIGRMGHWDWNIETGSLMWSDEIYRIFGLRPQEFEATYEAFVRTIHPDDRDKVTSAVGAAVEGTEIYDVDHRIVLPDGEVRMVNEQGQVTRNDKDEPTRMIGIVRDITEEKKAEEERERLHQDLIEAQQQAIHELSTPIIPLMEGIIVLPLVGSLDSHRARTVTRNLLVGISHHRAKIVIIDITGVQVVDSGVANHLDKTMQAARLKGAQTIITGMSDAVAETIVDLGIDWSRIETLSDLQTGLVVALKRLGITLKR